MKKIKKEGSISPDERAIVEAIKVIYDNGDHAYLVQDESTVLNR